MTIDLKVKLGEVTLKNPIMTASGTYGYGEEFNENFYKIEKLGAVVTKGISLKPRHGNPTPRVCETASGMLNAIGLQNVGLEVFLKEKLPFLKKNKATVVVNFFGTKIEEYADLAAAFDQEKDIAAVELNISCPNVKEGGVQFGKDPKTAAEVTSAVRKRTKKHLMVKVSPNCSDIPAMALHLADAGADSLSVINTITGMAVDTAKMKPVLANVVGGLSGPAIKPIALRMVWESYNALKNGGHKIPIIGIGGIMNANDVIEFLLVGATAVQVGTANFVNPNCAIEILDSLSEKLSKYKIKSVTELVGQLKT